MVSRAWSGFYGGLRKGSISSSLLMARFIVTSDSVNAQLPLKKKDALLWFAFIIRPPIHSHSKPAVGAEYGGGFCREASLL